MGKLFGRQNPNYSSAEQLKFANPRQPKALPTIKDVSSIVQVLKTTQQKLKHVQTSPAAPATPLNFNAVGIVGAIKLSWGQVIGADGYIILKNSSPDFTLPGVTHIILRNAKATSFIDSTVGDSVWWYQVVATTGTLSQPQSVQSVPTALLSATALPNIPPFGKNLVPNAGFEQNIVGTPVNVALALGQPISDSWSVLANNNNVFSVELENTGNSRSGNQNILFSLNQNTSVPTGQSFAQAMSTAKMPLAVGDIVRVNAWIKINTTASLANFTPSAAFGLLVYDGNGNFLGFLNFVNAAPGSSYQFFQSAVTIPATLGGGTPAYCRFYIQGTLQNSTGGAVATGANQYGNIRVDDVRCVIQNTAFDLTPISTAYVIAMAASPLSATTGGVANHATVTVGAHTAQFGDGAVAYNSGSITPLNDSTSYLIFASDPTYSGGAVSWQQTPTSSPATANGANGNVSPGAVTTPAFGGGGTSGVGGGSGPAAIGQHATKF